MPTSCNKRITLISLLITLQGLSYFTNYLNLGLNARLFNNPPPVQGAYEYGVMCTDDGNPSNISASQMEEIIKEQAEMFCDTTCTPNPNIFSGMISVGVLAAAFALLQIVATIMTFFTCCARDFSFKSTPLSYVVLLQAVQILHPALVTFLNLGTRLKDYCGDTLKNCVLPVQYSWQQDLYPVMVQQCEPVWQPRDCIGCILKGLGLFLLYTNTEKQRSNYLLKFATASYGATTLLNVLFLVLIISLVMKWIPDALRAEVKINQVETEKQVKIPEVSLAIVKDVPEEHEHKQEDSANSHILTKSQELTLGMIEPEILGEPLHALPESPLLGISKTDKDFFPVANY